MEVATSCFDSFERRSGDLGLQSRWLFSQGMLERRELLEGRPVLCCVCGALAPLAESDPSRPVDAREGLLCAQCGMSARQRAAFTMLEAIAAPSDRIYITEQSTRLYALLQARYPNARGSEFEPDEGRRREMADYLAALGGNGGIAFEDVTRLSMPDSSQDVVLSFDVLEHVPDYRTALGEFARVLKRGGRLLATFPFTDRSETVTRASVLEDGGIQHHLEPEYHGDPIGGPVLCFYHFGWDLLDEVRAAGFEHAAMAMPWSPEQGLLYGHWTLTATR